MSSYRVVIPFTPIPKASARVGRWGAYVPTSKQAAKVKAYVASTLTSADLPLLYGPLLLIVTYYLPMPKSTRSRKDAIEGLPHDKRPDGDNLDKFLCDALTGVLWADDSRIVVHVRRKLYTQATKGRTVVYCKELSPLAIDYKEILADIEQEFSLQTNFR